MNRGALSSAANSSGPSIGASSLVTDANSALSGGSHLQRSSSVSTDPYLRLPASPMSFSSNNISGSSTIDGSSIVQQSPHQDQIQKQASSSVTSLPSGAQVSGNVLHPQKKPRLDVRQDELLQQQVIQQLLQRQESLHMQRHHNPQMQALLQQKFMQERHQQQMLQSLPPLQRAHLLQQQQQQQQRLQQLQQQALQPGSYVKRPSEGGVCSRRLMQYMYHQRHRPPDNNIMYWRKFVAEYFSPRAKKKWCLSSYDNVSNHALGVFPQTSIGSWNCDICGSKSGKGFEATFEVLPRLNKIIFDSGVIDELLFVDMPHECRLPSGIMLLEYAKATQESVYDQLRVVHEGQLRIIFSQDLKILSWEFCVRHHEDLLPRRLVAPQVNQLVQVAQKYTNAVSESGTSGMPSQDLQTNCNLFVTAGRQLARNLELQSLNELGLSKRYVRCLQISEVVNSMKDLITFSRDHKIGAIESLKTFPRKAAARGQNLQVQNAQEANQLRNPQNLPNDQGTLNKLMHLHPSMSSQMVRNNSFPSVLSNSPQGTIALNNYQALLRQNSMNSNFSSSQADGRSTANTAPSSASYPVQASSGQDSMPNNTLANSSSVPQRLMHLSTVRDGNLGQRNIQQPSQSNQYTQQQAIQQMLQEMINTSGNTATLAATATTTTTTTTTGRGINYQTASVTAGVSGEAFPNGGSAVAPPPCAGTSVAGNGIAPGISAASSMPESNAAAATMPNMTDGAKSVPINSNAIGSGNSVSTKPDAPPSPQLNDLIQDISQDFINGGLFDMESGDYEWKL